jgi:hypothetical protein
MIVEALRTTYKTLGETLHQDFSMTTPPTPEGSRDEGGGPRAQEPAEAEAMVRFEMIRPRGREALRQAQLYSESNEDAYRRGDQITVPLRVFQDISAALIDSNELMTEVLSQPRMLQEVAAGGTAAILGHPPNHGDYGAAWDPINYGDWFTTHSGESGHD